MGAYVMNSGVPLPIRELAGLLAERIVEDIMEERRREAAKKALKPDQAEGQLPIEDALI